MSRAGRSARAAPPSVAAAAGAGRRGLAEFVALGALVPGRGRGLGQVPKPGGKAMSGNFDFDVIVIGSGFGGSVAALRATEKGYRVGVMESGRRWDDEDLPLT